MVRQTEKQTDRRTNRQTDGQTDGQTDRKIDMFEKTGKKRRWVRVKREKVRNDIERSEEGDE